MRHLKLTWEEVLQSITKESAIFVSREYKNICYMEEERFGLIVYFALTNKGVFALISPLVEIECAAAMVLTSRWIIPLTLCCPSIRHYLQMCLHKLCKISDKLNYDRHDPFNFNGNKREGILSHRIAMLFFTREGMISWTQSLYISLWQQGNSRFQWWKGWD